MGPHVETSKMAVKSVNGSFPSPDELPLTTLQVIDWETKTGAIAASLVSPVSTGPLFFLALGLLSITI